MNDTAWLATLLVLVYLGECFGWTSKHTVLFRHWFGGATFPDSMWNWSLPGFGNQKSGLHLRHILPPLGSVFHCPVWPASLSPAGALAWVPFSMDQTDRPDQSATFIPWHCENRDSSDTPAAYAEDKVVFLHGQTLVKCATEAQTRRVIQLLHNVHQAPDAASRGQVIDAEWQSAFDANAIRKALDDYRDHTRSLRIIANLLFVHLFLVTPATILMRGLGQSWLPLLLVLMVLMLTTSLLFFSAHRRLQPQLSGERWKHTGIVLLSPPAAIRALDALARDQLIGFHPLAVAQLTLPTEKFLDFAQRYIRDLRYAMPSQIKVTTEVRDTLQWHMRREANVIRRFLDSLHLAAGTLKLTHPPLVNDDCLSYCPRCQCQFIIPADPKNLCTLCDVPLIAFA